jgi:hypothetical protein
MRPRQRAPPADHSRQRRMTNVLTGGTGDDLVIRCQHITEVSKRSQIILSIDPFASKSSHNRPARRAVLEEGCLRTPSLFRVAASSTSCEQRCASASGQSIEKPRVLQEYGVLGCLLRLGPRRHLFSHQRLMRLDDDVLPEEVFDCRRGEPAHPWFYQQVLSSIANRYGGCLLDHDPVRLAI